MKRNITFCTKFSAQAFKMNGKFAYVENFLYLCTKIVSLEKHLVA